MLLQLLWRMIAMVLVAVGILCCSTVQVAVAAEQASIQAAIRKGQNFLLSQSKTGPQGSLACYALVKSGIDKKHPDVQKVVAEVLAKCRSGKYSPTQHHNYEAGVDALLLEAVDPEAHRPELQSIATHLIGTQNPCGAWYYDHGNKPEYGDTSITQYAILGLWAAARSGVEIPAGTWDRAAQWLVRTQLADGGFCYQPFDKAEHLPDQVVSSITMTAAGAGSLLIIRTQLFNDVQFDNELRPIGPTRRFGLLERVPDDKPKTPPKAKVTLKMTASSIDKSLKESVRWTGDHFAENSRYLKSWSCYYYYGIERVAALLDVEKLGTHNWYTEGSDSLLLRQLPDGGWIEQGGPLADTAFSLLFLTKVTASIVTKPKRTPLVGGGLLIGGRGLPENLDAVAMQEGQVATRKLLGKVDGLLADLEKSSDAKVEAVQAAVIEAVQLDRPEDLIPQLERLKKLATDPRVEVRRTAMWALGRTGDIRIAPLLIQGLKDGDEGVVREASVGLSILSRKPDGCGVPVEPTEGLPEEASDAERKTHLDTWRKESAGLWQKWYLRVRPYNERDDRLLLKRKS